MQRGSAEDRAIVKHAIETGDSERLGEIITILRRTGAIDVANQAASAEAARAIAAAQLLPPGPHANCLTELADQLLKRQA